MPERVMRRGAWKRALWAFAIGLAISGALGWQQQQQNEALTQARFAAQVERTTQQLLTRVRLYEYGLRGARGVIITAQADRLSHDSFVRYARSRDIASEFPGARGFGFIRRVPPHAVSAFVTRNREDGRPDFTIRSLGAHDGELWVIQFVEPEDRNEQAVGLDIASEAKRREAAYVAMQSGRATLTAPVTIVQAAGLPKRSFLLLLPVYASPPLAQSTDARERVCQGWTYAPLIIDEVLAGVDLREDILTVTLSDATSGETRETFYASRERAQTQAGLQKELVREVYGRRWVIEVTARPAFVAELNLLSAVTVLGIGVLASLLLSALLFVYLTAKAKELQVLLERARLSDVVKNSSDAIIGEALDGTIVSWNGAATAIFGYTEQEVLGRTLESLNLAEHAEEAGRTARALRGEFVAPFETARVRRDGTALDVSVALSPIRGLDGDISGLGHTIRDISDRKANERRLTDFNLQLELQVRERTAELEAATRDLHTILDAIPSLIGYWGKDGRNRFANRTFGLWLGRAPEELKGLHIAEVLGPAIYEQNRALIAAALRGEAQAFERTIESPHTGRPIESLVRYIPDIVDGEVRGYYVLAHDVTELMESRRKLTAAQRENDALLQTIHLHAMVAVLDPRGLIVDVNESLCRLTGYRREELIGEHHGLLESPDLSSEFWQRRWASLTSGQVNKGELRLRTQTGGDIFVDNLTSPFLDGHGRVEKYVSMSTDITATKLAADALALERQRLDNILRGTNVGTWEWNVQTGETRFNERWAEIVGHSLGELSPTSIQTWLGLAHPDDLAESEKLLAQHFDGTLPYYECEYRMRHNDGHWVWVLDRGRVSSFTADGKPEWMSGTHQDITSAKLAQRKLAESEAFLERAGGLAGVGGWRIDLISGEVLWTRQTRRIHEVDDEYVPTLATAIQFYPPEEQPVLVRVVERARAEGTPWDVELRFSTATGQPRWVRSVGQAEFENGSAVRLVGAFQDVTARRAADEALQTAIEAANAASDAKSHFLANMSHEIRTPLNAVIGFSYLLERSLLTSEQRELLSKIQLSSRALLAIISDILDLSKIEAGEMTLDNAPFEASTVPDEIRTLMAPQAEQKGLSFVVRTSGLQAIWLRGDVTRLRQIVLNLVSNALKFTSAGSIEVVMEVASESTPSRVILMCRVRDTGMGIPPDVLPRLFTPFTQADASTTRRFGGTGLGLSIVKRLSELMGGDVSVTSEVSRGSEFCVRVPFEPMDASAASAGHGLHSFRVAVVHDDHAQRARLCAHVAALGWRAEPATNLEDVTEVWRHGAALPDVVVLGSSSSAEERGATWQGLVDAVSRSVPEVALVLLVDEDKWAANENGRRVVAAGATLDTISDLFNAVNRAVVEAYGSSDRLALATRHDVAGALWLSGVRILVVDDAELNLDVARRILEREGALVETCTDGVKALETLREARGAFDIVLLDVQMPVMDGNEAARRIRTIPELERIPIVALTAGATMAERELVYGAGMNEFISKPLNPHALVSVVRRQVELATGVPLLVRRMDRASENRQEAWPEIDGLDAGAGAEHLGHDLALLRSTLGRLVQDVGDVVSGSELEAWAAADPVGLALRLHRLRGSAGMVGAKAIESLCAEVEAKLRAAPQVAVPPELLRRLADSVGRVVRGARTYLSAQPGAPRSARRNALEPGAAARLRQMLLEHDLAALAYFQGIAESLATVMERDVFSRLSESIENLQFVEAASLLPESDVA